MQHFIWNNSIAKHQILQIGLSLLLLFVSNCTCKLTPQDGNSNSNNNIESIDTSSTNNQEEPPVKPGIGGGIDNIGNSCYMNATLQLFKAVYPHVFDGKSDPISQAGQKLMEALDKEACASGEIAKNFFQALQGQLADSAWIPGKGKQEDAAELLTALLDKLDFPKAVKRYVLMHPTTGVTRRQTSKDKWNMMSVPINSSTKETMQYHFDASLGEETRAADTKWGENDLNPTPGIKAHSFLDKLSRLKEDILVVQLKRFSYDLPKEEFTKIPTIVEDPFHLVIKKEQIDEGTEDIAYELVGFISHSGGYGGGHYVAYAKKSNQWGYYSDSTVTPVSEQEANTAAKEAYIFFYKRK